MKKQKPFFERFLENQHLLSEKETKNIQAGEIRETLKWPSDNDEPAGEGNGSQTNITMKYPSDTDEVI